MSVAVGANERLAALTAAGTSVWLDQIRRSLIEGGELQRLIDEMSLRGVTSNPAIFQKAILGPDGAFLGMTTFGESGPAPAVYEHFGITAEGAAELGRSVLDRVGARS